MEKITITLKQLEERLENVKIDAQTVLNETEAIIRDVRTGTWSFEVGPIPAKVRKPREKKVKETKVLQPNTTGSNPLVTAIVTDKPVKTRRGRRKKTTDHPIYGEEEKFGSSQQV